MKNLLIAILSVSVTTSCVKEVSVDIPIQETVPVVSCILKSDSILELTLNQTQTIFENKNTVITDALVQLLQDGVIIDTLRNNGNNIFISGKTAEAEIEYTISVDVEGFEKLAASDVIPKSAQVSPRFFRDSVTRDVDGDLISRAEVDIVDDDPEKNYYELDLNALIFDTETETFEHIDVFFDTNNDIVFQNEGLLGLYPDKLLFTDDLFNMGAYTLNINYGGIFFLFETGVDPISDYRLIVDVRTVSKNYYDYKKTLIEHLEGQDGDVWTGVSEPARVFSNLNNGFGIFAGYSQVTDTIIKFK